MSPKYHQHNSKKRILSGALSACLLVPAGLGLATTSAFAQVVSGTISGTVQDASGAIIPNAPVVLTNTATGDKRTSKSNGSGLFSFTGLPSGDFSVTITSPGFQTFTENGVHLDPGDSRNLPNLALKTGDVNSVVNVQAESSVPLDTGELSNLITAEEIKHLSVEGRDVTELLKTLPGFAIASQNNTNVNNQAADPSQVNVTGSLGQYSANGNLATGNSLKLDGANLTDPGNFGGALQNVNYDQVAEVKVQTSNFGPEYSQGPIIVSAVTKSGGDHFHGDLYAYARTYQLDSSDALNGPTSQAKDPDREVYPGFTVGGPVLIPHTNFNHNRALTFFAGAEDYAQRNVYAYGSSGSALVHSLLPTAAMRTGNFSQAELSNNFLGPNLAGNASYANVETAPTYAKDGTLLTNGILPAGYIDPGGSYLFNSFPLPNSVPTSSNPYNWQGVDYVNQDLWQAIGRVDLAISQKNHFFARYSVERGTGGEPAAVYYNPNGINTPGGGEELTNSEGAAANLTTIITSTMTNQVYGNLIYLNQTFASPNPSALTGYPYQGAYANGRHAYPQIQAYNSPYGSGGLPLAITPDYSLGPIFAHKFDPEFGDNLTKVLGNHTITTGVYGLRVTNNQTADNQITNGAISNYYLPGAGSTLTDLSVGGKPGNVYTMSGNWSTNELEGFVGGYTQQNVLPDINLYFWDVDFFAGDSWKIVPRLTVNYGARFEHLGLWNDSYGVGVAVFNPALITSGASNSPYPGFLWHKLDSSIPDSGVNSYPLFTEPRVGFAWDIRGNGQTVMRGGWGEYRGHDSWNITSPAVNLTQNANTVTLGASSLSAISQQNISPGVTAPPNTNTYSTTGTVYGLTPGDYQEPVSDTYSLTINQQLPKHMAMVISYVGDNNRFLDNGGSTQTVTLDNVNAIPIGGLYRPDPDTGSSNYGRVLTPTGLNPANTPAQNSFTVGGANAQQVDEYRPLNTPTVQYADIDVVKHNLFANYNGLQMAVAKQTGRILFNVNYTYSKALGIQGAGADDSNGFPSDPFNVLHNYGPESFDRRHIFNATYTFEVGNPVQNRLIGELTNGWELSGITTLQSGGDIVAISSPSLSPSGTIGPNNIPGTGVNGVPAAANPNQITVSNTVYLGTPDVSLQPTVLCNPKSGLGAHQFANAGCFGLPNLLQNGAYQLPFISEPAYFDTDLSAQKSFAITHDQNIQFRFSAFNFINHPLSTVSNAFSSEYQLNFTNPTGATFAQNASSTATSFGSDPFKTGRRVVELMAKYNF